MEHNFMEYNFSKCFNALQNQSLRELAELLMRPITISSREELKDIGTKIAMGLYDTPWDDEVMDNFDLIRDFPLFLPRLLDIRVWSEHLRCYVPRFGIFETNKFKPTCSIHVRRCVPWFGKCRCSICFQERERLENWDLEKAKVEAVHDLMRKSCIRVSPEIWGCFYQPNDYHIQDYSVEPVFGHIGQKTVSLTTRIYISGEIKARILAARKRFTKKFSDVYLIVEIPEWKVGEVKIDLSQTNYLLIGQSHPMFFLLGVYDNLKCNRETKEMRGGRHFFSDPRDRILKSLHLRSG